jgi:hypothetical protein
VPRIARALALPFDCRADLRRGRIEQRNQEVVGVLGLDGRPDLTSIQRTGASPAPQSGITSFVETPTRMRAVSAPTEVRSSTTGPSAVAGGNVSQLSSALLVSTA